MPIRSSRLKPLKLYKNREIYIHDIDQNKKQGNLIAFLSSSMNETIELFNSSLLYTRYINCYYEKRIFDMRVENVYRKGRVPIQADYKKIKTYIPQIKKAFPVPQQYQSFNLAYDLRPQNELFFQNVKLNFRKKADGYCTFLKEQLTDPDLKQYPRKTILIPLSSNYLQNGTIDNPLSAIFTLIFYDENKFRTLFPASQYQFICVNTKQNLLFTFDSNYLNKKRLPRLQTLINISRKLDIKEQLTDIEQAILNEPADDLEDAKDNKQVSTQVVNKVISTLSNDPNPRDFMASLTGVEVEIANKMEEVAEKVANAKNISNPTDLLADLNNNEEFLKYMNDMKIEKLTANANRMSSKRNELLKAEQKTRKINDQGKSIKEILDDYNSKSMDREVYNIKTFNDGVKTSTLKDFEVSYNKKQKEKDTIAILNSFSENKEIPIYIRKIEKKNTSDAFNKKETWTITMEDERRLRHTITIDIPLFIDDHFLYLSESKKSISHQFLLLPIVKTNFDTVQCTSNYNKAFIFRYGSKISPKLERLKKLISVTKSNKISFLHGDNRLVNTAYLTNMDYDELALSFMYIKFDNFEFHFNQTDLRDILTEKEIKFENLKDNELPIGLNNGNLIILDVNKNVVKGTNEDLADYIINRMLEADGSLSEELKKINVPKKFVYSRASVLSRRFPLIVLLAFKDGLTTVMKKAKIKHEFSDKRKNLSIEEKNTKGEIRFADGYLYYDLYPFRNSLLLNGLAELPTENYEYKEFDDKEVYIDIFELLFKTRNIAKGISNFIDLFLDPITIEVAESINLPTTFTEFFLHANALLEDNSFIPENNMNLYRIRSNEIVNGLLYKVLANAYANYKNTANSNNPQRMSVPRDALLKELNACTIINDYSTINPIFEAEAYGAVTYKGPSGLNLDDSFTLGKRAFDETMVGTVGISSPYNNKVGVSRQLAFNPQILNNRGMIKPGKKGDPNLNVSNILTPAEILTPWSANHDDSPRTAMVSGQSKHIIPVAKTDKLLVGNGAQKALPHMIGGEFVHAAKQDGKVVKRDENTQLMIIQYKDGSFDTIDLGPHVAKNGGGGFYVHNTKVSDLKEGDTFKKGQIIAKNPQYFRGGLDDTEYVVGNLTKVAIHSGYYTFEDASICTENFCKEMTSYITMKKEVVLGAKTNIDHMAKIGQKVKTGDPLLIFEQAFDEDEANAFLARLGDDLDEEITKMSKNYVKSKYTGVVEDIRIYFTIPESQLSPSLRKVVRDYNNKVKAKQELIRSFYGEKESNLIIPPCEQIEAENGKIKGVEVGEGVLIEFYVKYEDTLGIGKFIAA